MTRRVFPAIFATALVSAVVYARYSWVGYYNDDAYYVMGARSLLQGRYVHLCDPLQAPMVTYQPGFPLFLAPFVAVLAPSWGALKAVGLAVTASAWIWAAVLFRPWLGAAGTTLFLAAYALNPYVDHAAANVMTEHFFLLLALALFHLLRKEETAPRPWRGWAMGALIGWAALTRPAGLSLLPAALAGLWISGRRACAAKAAAAGLGIWGLFALRNYAISRAASGYWPRFGQSLEFLADPFALLDNLSRVANLFFVSAPLGLVLPHSAAGIAASAALAAGMLFLCVRGIMSCAQGKDKSLAWAMAVFVAGYCAVHAAWAAIDSRYPLPVLPFLLAFALAGAAGFLRTRPAKAFAAIALLAALAAGHARILPKLAARSQEGAFRFPAKTLEWLRANTPSGAVLLTPRAAMMWLYTGRRAVPGPAAPVVDREELRHQLLAEGVSHIIVQPMVALYRPRRGAHPSDWRRELEGWVESWPEAFPLAFESAEEGSRVYNVRASPRFMKAFLAYVRARAALEAGRYEEGWKGLDAALAAEPRLVKALNAYGAACALSGRRLAAGEERLGRALAVEPRNFWAWLNLARVRRLAGRPSPAREALRRAEEALAGSPRRAQLEPVVSAEAELLRSRTP